MGSRLSRVCVYVAITSAFCSTRRAHQKNPPTNSSRKWHFTTSRENGEEAPRDSDGGGGSRQTTADDGNRRQQTTAADGSRRRLQTTDADGDDNNNSRQQTAAADDGDGDSSADSGCRRPNGMSITTLNFNLSLVDNLYEYTLTLQWMNTKVKSTMINYACGFFLSLQQLLMAYRIFSSMLEQLEFNQSRKEVHVSMNTQNLNPISKTYHVALPRKL